MAEPELWYPHAVRDPCDPALWGRYTDTGEPKFLLHTTEGPAGVYVPDRRTGPDRRYYGNPGNWPTYTLAKDAGTWRVYQHLPANRSAMSLRNLSGGVQTNRDNVTQVEIAWKAIEIPVLPEVALDTLAELLTWEHRVRGVPLVAPQDWPAYPASYGTHARQRMSGAAWDAYAGVCGHMHAPENDHGDPGAFPVGALLQRAREHLAPPPEEDDVPLTREEITAIGVEAAVATHALLWSQMQRPPANASAAWHPPRERDVGALLRRTYEMVGGSWTDVVHTRTGVERLELAVAQLELAARAAPVPVPVAAGDVTEAVLADAFDRAVDPTVVARLLERGARALAALLTRPAVLPPSEAPQ